MDVVVQITGVRFDTLFIIIMVD